MKNLGAEFIVAIKPTGLKNIHPNIERKSKPTRKRQLRSSIIRYFQLA
jgi:hypothetical protein